MADMGFLPSVNRLLELTSPTRGRPSSFRRPSMETLRFSPSATSAIRCVTSPTSRRTLPSDVEHVFWKIDRADRMAHTAEVITTTNPTSSSPGPAMVPTAWPAAGGTRGHRGGDARWTIPEPAHPGARRTLRRVAPRPWSRPMSLPGAFTSTAWPASSTSTRRRTTRPTSIARGGRPVPVRPALVVSLVDGSQVRAAKRLQQRWASRARSRPCRRPESRPAHRACPGRDRSSGLRRQLPHRPVDSRSGRRSTWATCPTPFTETELSSIFATTGRCTRPPSSRTRTRGALVVSVSWSFPKARGLRAIAEIDGRNVAGSTVESDSARTRP